MNLATADTPLGQLQRGLGSGFLWALKQKPGTVKPLLQQCLLSDPRWDHQLDDRGNYYGALIQTTGMDLKPLMRPIQDEDDGVSWLAISVLAALAKRGRDDAATMLREYVRRGSQFQVQQAVEELTSTSDRKAWQDLDDLLCARFPIPDDLDRHLPWVDLQVPPWESWVRSPTVLGEVLRGYEVARKKLEPDYSSMNTRELLDLAEERKSVPGIEDVLLSRWSANTERLLFESLDPSRPWRAIAALRVFSARQDKRVFEPTKAMIEQWQGGFNRRTGRLFGQPMLLRLWAARALASLPCQMTLPLAREWRSSRRWKYRVSASQILERCVSVEDIPWIRRRLSKRITDRRVYDTCDYAKWLSMFPEHGPFRALRRIYGEFPYSDGRRFVVRAMAATDTSFASELAYECLWDCEPTVRVVAAKSVSLANPGAAHRLRALTEDQIEDEDVRKAAEQRLAS